MLARQGRGEDGNEDGNEDQAHEMVSWNGRGQPLRGLVCPPHAPLLLLAQVAVVDLAQVAPQLLRLLLGDIDVLGDHVLLQRDAVHERLAADQARLVQHERLHAVQERRPHPRARKTTTLEIRRTQGTEEDEGRARKKTKTGRGRRRRQGTKEDEGRARKKTKAGRQ